MDRSRKHGGRATGLEVALLLAVQTVLIAAHPFRLVVHLYMTLPMPPHGFLDLLFYAISGNRDANRAFGYIWFYAVQLAVGVFCGLLVLGVFILLRAVLGALPSMVRRARARPAAVTSESEIAAFAIAWGVQSLIAFGFGFLASVTTSDLTLDCLDGVAALLALPVFFLLRRNFSRGDFGDDFQAADSPG